MHTFVLLRCFFHFLYPISILLFLNRLLSAFSCSINTRCQKTIIIERIPEIHTLVFQLILLLLKLDIGLSMNPILYLLNHIQSIFKFALVTKQNFSFLEDLVVQLDRRSVWIHDSRCTRSSGVRLRSRGDIRVKTHYSIEKMNRIFC